MLTTDQHHEPRDEDHDRDDAILQRVTASEIPALLDAFRAAAHAARVATDALHAHGIGPDRVTVEANLTDDGQPLVLITATTGTERDRAASRSGVDGDPLHWLAERLQHAVRRTNTGGGAGGPPTRTGVGQAARRPGGDPGRPAASQPTSSEAIRSSPGRK